MNDAFTASLRPTFCRTEGIYLSPAVLPCVGDITLPCPAGGEDHPLPFFVLADSFLGKKLMQAGRECIIELWRKKNPEYHLPGA